MQKILVIEDERNVSGFIKQGLSEENFEVTVAADGETGFSEMKSKTFDLVLLDRRLPGLDGLEICKLIREDLQSDVPIIMLTALNETGDIVDGLNYGADDYISKPFKFAELLARVKALLRRVQTEANKSKNLHFADLELNMEMRIAVRSGKSIRLTTKEFSLLEYFLTHPEKVHTRNEILKNVWNLEQEISTNVVDVYMNFLRNKIDKGFKNKILHTVVGVGYIMRNEDDY
jgi:two-component system, OmpR family, copper resistance phosphate regulon response regulator CusR